MAKDSIVPLTDYPPTSARKSLSPSQLATLYQTISSCLVDVLSLPPPKRDTDASRSFVASYAQDAAVQNLQPLIWGNLPDLSKSELAIRQRVLALAEKLVRSSPGFELQTLLDLSIIYSSSRPSQMKHVIQTALQTTPSILDTIKWELVPAFTLLLGESTGLYGVRKSAYCILAFLKVATPDIIRAFGSKEFLVSLARCYDHVMTAVAQSYGGPPSVQDAGNRQLDDWERIWIETKVDLLDAFHIILSQLLLDMSSASGQVLGVRAERTFDVIFAVLEISGGSPNSNTPFLDRSLLADYQQSYDLSKTLASALKHAKEKDVRLDLLESSLKAFEEGFSERKDPGVLKLIIKSSGFPLGIDNLGRGASVKGKGKASTPVPELPLDSDIDLKVSQVLDIFPDHSPGYISALLSHPSYPFRGNAEKVIEALLEGTAPIEEDVRLVPSQEDIRPIERRNVFDNEHIDVSKLHVGKKIDDAAILRDRTFIEQMKADILRRAEAISDDEDETSANGDRGIVAFDEEADLERVKVGGDGEESGEDEDEDEEDIAPQPLAPETILELAYIRDPKLFDRDAATKRSKARADLRSQTKWTDEQIEGWRIMLERNPKKDKILQKHEFSGNKPLTPGPEPGSSREGAAGGRGRGGARGRGRGRGGRGGSGGDSEARDRAWKNKNKSTLRKRGHAKKMAKGAPPPT
ncbi:hypothetical protein CPB85DRAFT_1216510 [Mucidula mucida]|nr:hypothetical protein CPB85DRAFT_1216510 [Mucidula mucida]